MKMRMPDAVYEFFKEAGAKGGKSKSPAKLAASRKNAAKAAAARKKKKKA
jgi:hypothetical protein